MADFKPCFNKVIVLEGGYTLHEVPGDRGGMTYAGIARNIWPRWEGWSLIDAGRVNADLTDMVEKFYKENFWDRIRGDNITAQQAAYQIFDFAVNAGLKTSVRIAQRILSATPDGIFGDETFNLLNTMVRDEKDERIFTVTFSLFKIFRYKNICMNDSRRGQDKLVSNLKFLCGWTNRVEGGLL